MRYSKETLLFSIEHLYTKYRSAASYATPVIIRCILDSQAIKAKEYLETHDPTTDPYVKLLDDLERVFPVTSMNGEKLNRTQYNMRSGRCFKEKLFRLYLLSNQVN